jgi:hypothetical protein
MPVEAYPVGDQMKMLMMRVLMEDHRILVLLKVHMRRALPSQLDKFAFGYLLPRRKAEGDVHNRLGYIQPEPDHFPELLCKRFLITMTLMIIKDLRTVLVDHLPAMRQLII